MNNKPQAKCKIRVRPSEYSTRLWELFCETHECVWFSYHSHEIECPEGKRGDKCGTDNNKSKGEGIRR